MFLTTSGCEEDCIVICRELCHAGWDQQQMNLQPTLTLSAVSILLVLELYLVLNVKIFENWRNAAKYWGLSVLSHTLLPTTCYSVHFSLKWSPHKKAKRNKLRFGSFSSVIFMCTGTGCPDRPWSLLLRNLQELHGCGPGHPAGAGAGPCHSRGPFNHSVTQWILTE